MNLRAVALCVALFAAACGSSSGEGTTIAPSSSFDPTGSWVLVEGTVDGEPFPLVDGWPVTMDVAAGRIGGTSACNNYGGRFLITNGEIDAAVTESNAAGCEPDVMASEIAFGAALPRIAAGGYDNGDLVLAGDGVTLRFAPQTALAFEDFMDREWVLASLIAGDGIELPADGAATLLLGSNGTLRATTGCRTVTGHFVTSETSISITDMSAEGECPPDLADQDGRVITVLESFTAEIDDGRLVLTAAGNEALIYTAAAE